MSVYLAPQATYYDYYMFTWRGDALGGLGYEEVINA